MAVFVWDDINRSFDPKNEAHALAYKRPRFCEAVLSIAKFRFFYILFIMFVSATVAVRGVLVCSPPQIIVHSCSIKNYQSQ